MTDFPCLDFAFSKKRQYLFEHGRKHDFTAGSALGYTVAKNSVIVRGEVDTARVTVQNGCGGLVGGMTKRFLCDWERRKENAASQLDQNQDSLD